MQSFGSDRWEQVTYILAFSVILVCWVISNKPSSLSLYASGECSSPWPSLSILTWAHSCSPIISSLLYLQQQSPALCRWMPNRRADLAEMLLPALSGGCSPAHGVLSLEGPGAIKILSGTAAVQPPVKCNLNHWMLKLCCSSGLEN